MRFARCAQLVRTDLRIGKRAVEFRRQLSVNRPPIACEGILMFAGAGKFFIRRTVCRHALKQRNGKGTCAMWIARDVRDAYHFRQLRIVTDADLFADKGAKFLATEILMFEAANAQLDAFSCDGSD